MELTKSKDCNPNYLAKIVQIDSFRPHPNADKLKLCTVDGCVISTSIDSQEGVYVYFPVECVINSNFLKINNLYRKSELNEDSSKQGFFEEQGRVKCIKLRGIASEGLVMPINDLYKFAEENSTILDSVEALKLVGTEFDTVNSELFVWKYVIQAKAAYFGKNKQPKKVLTILDDQFRYHIDTELLTRNIDKVNYNDIIQISWKEHGCVDGSTIINTNKGTFTIKEIVDNKLDVLIEAFDIEKNCKIFVPIDNYYYISNDGDWLEIELENGEKLQITTNNPVWLPLVNDYIRAENLKIGYTVLYIKDDIQYLRIKNIIPISRRDRYDLTINSTHNFFANNILIHNTSSIFCNLLTKTKYPWYKQLTNCVSKFLFKSPVYPEYNYHKFCSSRKVIKDPELNSNLNSGYYDCDIWSLTFEVIKEYLHRGLSVYTEIVGYMPTGSMIQTGYDYKCIYDPKTYEYSKMTPRQMYDAKLFNIIVYRITYTNVDGKVFEFSTQQVKEFCEKYGLNPVKELYYGRAKDLFPNIETDQNWHENFLQALRDKYLEKQSILCNNKVPEEGIVLRREISGIDVYKLKSLAFLQRETKMLDKGEGDIESNQ